MCNGSHELLADPEYQSSKCTISSHKGTFSVEIETMGREPPSAPQYLDLLALKLFHVSRLPAGTRVAPLAPQLIKNSFKRGETRGISKVV